MDGATIASYNRHASRLAERYEGADGGVERFFPLLFQKGQSVVDIGAGSGRDMSRLAQLGCDVWGIEPAQRLRQEAISRHSEFAERLLSGSLPDDLAALSGSTFDGVCLSAVLMHIPDAELFDTGLAIRSIIKQGGLLLVSVCTARDGIDPESDRDELGRFFRIRPVEDVQLLFERLGFSTESTWLSNDSLGRPDVEWATIILRYRGAAPRPIDRVESIINRDRKTATYKFALLRALSEIATTSPAIVSRRPDGTVAVPLEAVSELWIRYYWPFVAHAQYIPQTFGKGRIAFYEQLREMARLFEQANGLAGFVSSSTAPDLDPRIGKKVRSLRKKVGETIVKGPVTYAGSDEFSYANGEIFVQSDLWRELVLMGHWISDSIVLRWAELTSEKTDEQFKSSFIIDLLIQSTEETRMDSGVRALYRSRSDLVCAWSGKRLSQDFDVDHIIPFSVRHDSSIWNLVPAAKDVNASKSDKLPTIEALAGAEGRLVDEWRHLRDWNARRFDADAHKLLPGATQQKNWEERLFRALVQTIEYTATLRDVERWAG